MLKKYHVCLVMFFAVIALIAGIFLPRIYDRPSPQPEIALALFEPSSFIHARCIVGYEQPSPELIRKISVIYGPEDKDESTIPESMKSGSPSNLTGRVKPNSMPSIQCVLENF